MKVLNYSDTILDEILTRLIPEFQPTKIFLFGSRAAGTANQDSDYDLFLVVKDSNISRRDRMTKALHLLRGCEVAVDVFVYTEDEFNEWKDEFSSIPHTVVTEGKELWVG
ncbi:nucleotidyltransferase domain-containing protein [bacterium]|nr:nucleotidyltransferase domain-containing protein [bacterium]